MKNFNNHQKIMLIGIIAVFLMFIIYNLFLSPFAQCVTGADKYMTKAEAKVLCGKKAQ